MAFLNFTLLALPPPISKRRVKAHVSLPLPLHAPPDAIPRRVATMLELKFGEPHFISDGPLVSCLMITRNRLRQAQFAVDSFRRQTWRRTELLILDTTESDELAVWVAALNDGRILICPSAG